MFFTYFSFTLIPTVEIIREWGPVLKNYSMEIVRKPASEVTIHLEPGGIEIWSTKGGSRASFRLHGPSTQEPVLLDVHFYNLKEFDLKPASQEIVNEVIRALEDDPQSIHPSLRKTDVVPGHRRMERLMGKRWVFEIVDGEHFIKGEEVNLDYMSQLRQLGMTVLKWLYEKEKQIEEIEK